MAVEIPNLWPMDAIKVEVRTPLDILRVQAGYIRQASKGLLDAEISTIESNDSVSHQMDIIAPALGNYRHTILAVHHIVDMPYPATIVDMLYLATPKSIRDKGKIAVPGLEKKLSSEDKFSVELGEILKSEKVVALIQSLLARSRETNLTSTSEAAADG